MHRELKGDVAALRRQQGFTLIELMVVVAIIAILVGIGYPSYTQYTTKAKRSAAQGFMLQIASREEQYLADARTYTASFTTLGDPLYLAPPAETVGRYTVIVTSITATTDAGYIAGAALPQYIITATPVGIQADNDAKCGTLTLNSLGTKGKSGTGSVSDCWS
ncbi:MAG TPA: type IV pilin protein [Gallionella sp.]|nr:type IV pilin protein [Gallionella sp.]